MVCKKCSCTVHRPHDEYHICFCCGQLSVIGDAPPPVAPPPIMAAKDASTKIYAIVLDHLPLIRERRKAKHSWDAIAEYLRKLLGARLASKSLQKYAILEGIK